MRRVAIVLALVLAAAAAACGGEGGGATGPSATGSPSGGAPTQADTTVALTALCAVAAATDPDTASAAFYDRAPATLHAIAAAAGERDRAAEGALLVRMQRVEADLEVTPLPPAFSDDVAALRSATGHAASILGLDVPSCD